MGGGQQSACGRERDSDSRGSRLGRQREDKTWAIQERKTRAGGNNRRRPSSVQKRRDNRRERRRNDGCPPGQTLQRPLLRNCLTQAGTPEPMGFPGRADGLDVLERDIFAWACELRLPSRNPAALRCGLSGCEAPTCAYFPTKEFSAPRCRQLSATAPVRHYLGTGEGDTTACSDTA